MVSRQKRLMRMRNASIEGIGHALIAAAKFGDIDRVGAYMLMLDPTSEDSSGYYAAALCDAAKEGHLNIVQLLILVCDSKDYDSMALKQAALSGHSDVVCELIPVSDPKANDSEALSAATRTGHLDIVRELIPVSDPKADESAALRWAALYGHYSIFRELIPVSDPRAKNSEALQVAAQGGHHEMVRDLAPLSDVLGVFRAELENAESAIGTVYSMRSIDSILLNHSLVAVDALVPHVSDLERDRAVKGLPSSTVESMPRLRAWRDAQALRAQLPHAAPPSRTTPSRVRLS